MGGMMSTPAPPSPPLLHQSWRQIDWSDRQSDLQYMSNYTPPVEGQCLRILLHGPVGAGKSSFINSVNSVLRGRMCTPALASNCADECFTKKYTTYKIQKGNTNTYYPFVFNDMMGIKYTSRRTRKVHVKDIKRALKGHVRDGYTFNPEYKMSKESPHYNNAPTLNDKVHALVFVIDANTESLMKLEVVETIRDVRDEASDLGIPQVVIFTKIDEACPEIKRDVKNVYTSKLLKKKMHRFSADVGIPMNCIFAVKNYHEETVFSTDVNTLILSVLRHIINFADDFFNNKQD